MAKFKSLFTSTFLLVYFACTLNQCCANLNLYLNQIEVRRLLGLQAELFYVRDGVLNEYALNFVVPVPAHLGGLHFTWQSLAGRPLPYSIAVTVSNPEALAAPILNISDHGSVPTVVQTFAVELPCTGVVAAEVDVVISINVTLNRANNNVTRLNFKRVKICLRGPPTHVSSQSESEVVVGRTETEASSALYVAVSCACALVTVFAIALLACYLRNNKSRRHGDMLQESRGGSNCSAQGLAPAPVLSGTLSSRRPSYTRLDQHCDRSNDLQHRIAQLTIQSLLLPRCRCRLKSVLLEGTFGRVYRGSYTDEDGGEEEVMVKTVTDHASSMQVSLLLQEGMTMYGLSHKNILSILGVSIEDHTAPFLIYPHQGYTNLKRFLQKCKLCPEGVAHTLTTQEVVDMALQVITGMQYLHKKRLLHKDLATRNCVVDDKLRVQITDNALSRDLFPADYHCLGDNENRPVKWLSIESLSHKTFSTASDVWAFGVLLWELTTLAQQPYVEIDPFEIAAYLRDGYRLAQPVNCPDELFAVMAYCWAMNADDRPTFSQLLVCLQEFYAQLTRYV
ncbi:tyrosine-protein kinase Dnt-like isoform X1 [Macrosteles quadrilineatus]|uniref:tyrosine-protein kinase Dnt-like isoform X1 n=1 Tax=Macrosteles quadrilineatus TaxID=74068 RepID=UPI0023E190F0|nr:tyrosine-protein kinase Dnt-like isoform X1 [Macrosteles quadrilineatus]